MTEASIGGSVEIVVASFRRPERLRTALDSLARSAARLPPHWTVGITVVDDDPESSAQQAVANFGASFAGVCTYLRCGSRNISTARNTGLESALDGGATWVGSIDNDVVVPADWFEACLRALASDRHNAVTGPLVKDFDLGPSWLTKEPFHRLGVLDGTDGVDAFTCATGNNWVQGDFLRTHPSLRFSPDLGVTGGEDMDFFYRAIELGLRPVFDSRIGVTEREPVDRCTLRYQIRRAFWLGTSEAQISLGLGKATRVRLVARAMRRALNRGAAHLTAAEQRARGPRYTATVWAQCVGLLLGTLGLRLSHK